MASLGNDTSLETTSFSATTYFNDWLAMTVSRQAYKPN